MPQRFFSAVSPLRARTTAESHHPLGRLFPVNDKSKLQLDRIRKPPTNTLQDKNPKSIFRIFPFASRATGCFDPETGSTEYAINDLEQSFHELDTRHQYTRAFGSM
jgi:hypothetical protein